MVCLLFGVFAPALGLVFALVVACNRVARGVVVGVFAVLVGWVALFVLFLADVVSLLVVLAVCVFEVCKALCTGVAGGAAIELLAALRPAVG